MSQNAEEILHKELEIPQIVWEKAEEAFTQIGRGTDREESVAKKRTGGYHLSKAAVIVIGFLLIGTTTVAAGVVNAYRQRMESIPILEIEDLYQMAGANDVTFYNRSFSAGERERMQVLKIEYETEDRFPQKALKILESGERYAGRGIAVDVMTGTVYLPEKELSDEELLEIVDFEHKLSYAVYMVNLKKRTDQNTYESLMIEMTNAEIEKIYLAYTAASSDISGGYSRKLTDTEKERYAELGEKYEKECRYPEADLEIIKTLNNYRGNGVAFCEENSGYCLPEEELSDEELLQLIDFEHKVRYCFSRLAEEIQLGLRKDYPKAVQE